MKKALLVTMLALCINSAFAAETAVMKVQGKLTNSSCTPELSNGGTVDYGTISLASLSATDINQLGKRDFTLTITCVTPTKIAFSTTDDRNGTAPLVKVINGRNYGGDVVDGDKLFGVNKTAGGVNIGNYSIYVNEDSMQIDGNRGFLIYSSDNGSSWGNLGVGEILYNRNRIATVAASTQNVAPVAFTTAVIPMTTALAIQGTDTLAITDDTPIDGQATFTLIYL